MIPLDKLQAINHVVVHNDADGVASAMIIRDALPGVKVSVVAYDSPEHKNMPADPGMCFCDFSPYIDRYPEFVEAGTIVLDHHEKQKPVIDAFGELGVYGDNALVEAGAFLAFREVWRPLKEARIKRLQRQVSPQGAPLEVVQYDSLRARIEDFARLVSIRDTWQTKNERWREACETSEALHFWPDEHLLSGIPSEDWHSRLLYLGPMLFQRKLKAAQKCIDGGRRWTSNKGTKCIAFVGIYQVSDAAEILNDTVDLVLAFTYYLQEGSPYLRVSCRSHTGWDVGEFSRTFPGGGGHKASSGFQVGFHVHPTTDKNWMIPNPYAHIQQLVDDYEEDSHGS